MVRLYKRSHASRAPSSSATLRPPIRQKWSDYSIDLTLFALYHLPPLCDLRFVRCGQIIQAISRISRSIIFCHSATSDSSNVVRLFNHSRAIRASSSATLRPPIVRSGQIIQSISRYSRFIIFRHSATSDSSDVVRLYKRSHAIRAPSSSATLQPPIRQMWSDYLIVLALFALHLLPLCDLRLSEVVSLYNRSRAIRASSSATLRPPPVRQK